MLSGGMANRDIPRDKLLARPDVLNAWIMRGPAMARQFGPGDESALPSDDLDCRALGGETISEIRDGADGRVLTVLVPLPAAGDFRGSDCISCHVAGDGEIPGRILQYRDRRIRRPGRGDQTPQ